MKRAMIQDDWIHVVAGALVTLSVVLAHLYSSWWLLVGLFVGLNLFQYGWTGFCPLGMILGKLGVQGRGQR